MRVPISLLGFLHPATLFEESPQRFIVNRKFPAFALIFPIERQPLIVWCGRMEFLQGLARRAVSFCSFVLGL